MTKRLTEVERGPAAEKIMEWANFVFAGFVIGQFVAGKKYAAVFLYIV